MSDPDNLAMEAQALSLEELAGGLLMVGFGGTRCPADLRRFLSSRHVGGVILFSRNYDSPDQVRDLLDEARACRPLPRDLLAAVDQEGGPVRRFKEPFAAVPPMRDVGLTGDPGVAHRLGQLMAGELRAVGVNLNLAPVVDVNSAPDNPVIGVRAFGATPELVARMGAAYVVGLQGRAVAGCAKHFPGHGDTLVDSHHALPVLRHDLKRLKKVELVPFVRLQRIPVASVMMGHLLLPKLDPERPASLSPAVVQGLLRQELGYEGVVISDDLEMAAVADRYGPRELALAALEAGLDQILICHTRDLQQRVLDEVLELVLAGRVPRERLERSWCRVEALKRAYPPAGEPFDERTVSGPLFASLLREIGG